MQIRLQNQDLPFCLRSQSSIFYYFSKKKSNKKQKCSTQHCVLSTIPCKTKVCIVDISYQKITQAIQETILPATAKKSKRGPESSWRESLFIVQFRDLCWLRHQASTLYIKVNLTCDTLRINPNPLKSSIEKELKSEELSFSRIRYFWRLGLRKKKSIIFIIVDFTCLVGLINGNVYNFRHVIDKYLG